MSKLQHNGIRGVMLSWFMSYLSNRKQYVPVKNSSSSICLSQKLQPTTFSFVHQLLLLLLLKKVGGARLGESDIHPISAKTPAPQYQPIDRKKRKGKRVEDYSRDGEAQANKEALALHALENRQSHTIEYGVSKIVPEGHRNGIKVLLYCKVLQRGGA